MINLKQIEDILRETDVQSLIKIGCPEDEYNSEAKEIYNIILSKTISSIEELSIIIYCVFHDSFCTGLSYDPDGVEKEWQMPYDEAIEYMRDFVLYKNIAELIINLS